ncbi:hypothetical protein PVK06_035613 [Gossypium arboreum]|uniref:Uncharacterized protein n=1 Tax=Gossypium arboreum TaxID=29729 RepID=A0ABR0NH97_GOSAR|nr:hypothetical protein PVK06_035613 [Gossypium arboreum]
MDTVDSRTRASSISRKRLRLKKGFSSPEVSSDNRLSHYRPGKSPILPDDESFTFSPMPMRTFPAFDSMTRPLFLPLILPDLHMASTNAVDRPDTNSAPLPMDSNIQCQASHTSPISALYYTPPLGEV